MPAATAIAMPSPLTWRIFHCHCGRPVFFRNSVCLHCGRALGYEPQAALLLALEPVEQPAIEPLDAPAADADPAADVAAGADAAAGASSPSDAALWRVAGDADGPLYRRCGNHANAAGCNWLLPAAPEGGQTLCRCCRLNRTVPDLADPAHAALWGRAELAKRRLVSALISLGLPVASRVSEDPQRGLAFDLLLAAPDAPPVMTGHHDGIITLNLMEADDAARETVRAQMHEPYRTVLGHLRHESGHYYWSRLLEGSRWQAPFRALFGDERADYAQALEKHHALGPPADWAGRFVSAYASAHPWEDWAETWAHYLHMLDALDTAASAGLDVSQAGLLKDPFPADMLAATPPPGEPGRDAQAQHAQAADDQGFLAFVNGWVELTNVLNELSRSMGLPDFYPFVLSRAAVTKLHFVHRFIRQA